MIVSSIHLRHGVEVKEGDADGMVLLDPDPDAKPGLVWIGREDLAEINKIAALLGWTSDAP